MKRAATNFMTHAERDWRLGLWRIANSLNYVTHADDCSCGSKDVEGTVYHCVSAVGNIAPVLFICHECRPQSVNELRAAA